MVDSTLAENITFGLDINQIDFNKIHEVIKKVGLLKMVNLLPNGLNTLIGENGVNFQEAKAKNCIARALYFDADILFFDEATSSLDDKTANQIIHTLDKLKNQELTIIIISHNLNNLSICDRVIDLKK